MHLREVPSGNFLLVSKGTAALFWKGTGAKPSLMNQTEGNSGKQLMNAQSNPTRYEDSNSITLWQWTQGTPVPVERSTHDILKGN